MKKRILGVFATVMMLIGVCFFGGYIKEVEAAAGDVTVGDGFIAVEYSDLTEFRTEDGNIAPDAPSAYSDHIFAGWYQDAKCAKVYSGVSADATLAYAKFVPGNVLSVKAQLKADASEDANTNMRLVSSVDSLLYEEVGFEIYYNGAETPVKANSTKVYQRIVASTASGVDYNYSPKVIDVESEYFVTATLVNINKDNFGNGFYVKPYWVTLDGTVVYGVNKCVTVNNGLDSTNINLTIKADAAFTEPLTVTVGGKEYPATLALYDNVSCYDGTYNYVNVTVENRDSVLPSLSAITVTDGTTTGTATEYRNLMTKYVGTTASADTSWYDENKDKYVLATSADLYGFATKSSSVNFADTTVYVISDIVVNEEQLNTDSTDTTNYLKWYDTEKKEYITTPTYTTWNSIGRSKAFAGVFDGQGHTISGIYQVSSTSSNGFFGQTAAGSTIQNFELENSYFECTATGHTYHGSIAGTGNGNFYGIRSGATVVSAGNSAGGMFGQKNGGGDIINCCFDGSLTISGTNGGGFIGWYRAGTVNMKHCLFQGAIIGSGAGLGGLCGMASGPELIIEDSLCWGTLSTTTGWQASVVGRINSATCAVEVTNTYFSSSNTSAKDTGVKSQSALSVKNESKDLGSTSIVTYDGWYHNTDILSLDYENYWCLSDGTTPQLRSFTDESDVLLMLEGEGSQEIPWLITNKEELIAFSDMAQELDFSGKYVSIGTADEAGTLTIVLNEGETVDEVKTNAVAEGDKGNWIAIGTSKVPFAGTFNGNGNTISGLYLSTSESYQGLFGYVGGATIKNFALETSYLEYTGSSEAKSYIAGIVGYGAGTFQSLKSEADIVSSGERQGGIIGGLIGDSTISDCWYSGTMDLAGGTGGGIVGMVDRVDVEISNCLFSGTIAGDKTDASARYSGICGYLYGPGTLTINDCLAIGSIQVTVDNWNGSLVGYVDSASSTDFAQVNLSNTYTNMIGDVATKFAVRIRQYGNATVDGTTTADPGIRFNAYSDYVVSADDVKGYDAWYNNSSVLGLDFENDWCLVDGVTPQLRTFTNPEDILPMLDGQGTEESPWLITKAEDLSNLATIAKNLDFSGKYVSVGTADNEGELTIAINSGDTVAEVKTNAVAENGSGNWTPIGGADMPFAGTFNGNGNTISGLYYSGADTYVGLFGYISNAATIKNLKLTNSYLQYAGTGGAYMGSIVGCTRGTVDTVMSEAVLESKGQTSGGIAGGISFTGATTETIKLTNCWFDGIITLTTGTGRQSGGIVGYIDAPNKTVVIEHCLNTGNISATRADGYTQLGGICGLVNRFGSFAISDTLNAEVVQNSSASTGSVIGKIAPTTAYAISDVYGVDGLAKNETTYDHVIVGTGGTASAESTNYSVVDIEDAKGTDVWYKNTLTLDFVNYWDPVVDGTPELKAFSTNGVGLWSGQGTQSSPWIITNKAELEVLSSLAQTYGFDGKYFQLGTDEQAGELVITVNEGTVDEIKASNPTNWVPIGRSNKAFNGSFNGNGNTISGLYYNGTGTYVGLFSVTGVDAEVKNLKIVNSYFKSSATGNVHIGSIAGVGYGTLDTIKSEAEVVCCGAYGGGLVGSVWQYGGATFNDCWFAGELSLEGSAAAKCGGILGGCKVGSTVTQVDMTNCLNTGTINISLANTGVARVGGIVGFTEMNVNITNCLNAKSFTTTRGRASAIIGEVYSGTTTLQNIYAIEGDGSATTYNSAEYYGHKGNGTVNLVDNSWAKLTAEQLAGANAQAYAASLFEEDKDGNVHWVVGDLYPTLNMPGEVYDLIPTMTVATSENTSTILTGDGNFVTTVTGTTIDNYTEYTETLVTSKFEKVAENTITDTVYSTTYTRGNLVLCANHFVNEGKTTISYYDGPVSGKLVKGTTTAAAGTNTTLHMIELFEYGNSFVVQLKNGHFLINDGGQADDLPYLLDYLEELAGENKPVVEGWFITHAHGDHTGAFNDFWNNRDWANRISVEGVYYSSPSDVILDAPGCGTASLDHKIAQITSTLLRSEEGEATKLYRPQTGQKYYFDDITIDILLAQEQLPVDETTARTNLNSSSTVCLFTFEAGTDNAQTCLIGGDIQETGFDIMFANYSETLFSTLDFFALNHHGFNTSAKIASMITANTVLLTVRDKTPVRCETAIKTLIGKADESMAWGNGTVVFTFPHVAGTSSYTVLPSKETVDEDGNNGWIYNVGETREEQPNLDVGTDGTTSDELE